MKRIHHFIISLTLIFMTFLPASAQKYQGGSGAFHIGMGSFDSKAISGLLPDGAPALKEEYMMIGGGGYVFFDRILLGVHGQSMIGLAQTNGPTRNQVSGGNLFGDIGYDLLKNPKLLLFPMIGAGWGGMTNRTSRNGNIPASDLTALSYAENSASWSSFMLDFQLGMDWAGLSDVTDNDAGGMMLGIRAGYILSFANANWNYAGGAIEGGPKYAMKGFYVRLLIGGGGYGKVAD